MTQKTTALVKFSIAWAWAPIAYLKRLQASFSIKEIAWNGELIN